MAQQTVSAELAFSEPFGKQEQQILTPGAIEFLTELVTRFTPQRNRLLAVRTAQQAVIDAGELFGNKFHS